MGLPLKPMLCYYNSFQKNRRMCKFQFYAHRCQKKKSIALHTMLILGSFTKNDIIPYLFSKKRHRKHCTLYIHFEPVQQSPSSGWAAGSACKTQWSFAGQLCNKVTESNEPRIGVFSIGLANRMPVLCHLGASVFLCSQCLFTGISLH